MQVKGHSVPSVDSNTGLCTIAFLLLFPPGRPISIPFKNEPVAHRRGENVGLGLAALVDPAEVGKRRSVRLKDEIMDPLGSIESDVREMVRRRGIDPAQDTTALSKLIDEAVADYDERAVLGAVPPLPSLAAARRQIHDNIAGFGPLQPLLNDPSVEEIWINAPAVAKFSSYMR